MCCERRIALLGFLGNNNRRAAALLTTKVAERLRRGAETPAPASSGCTSAVVSCHTGPRAPHAGAGAARSRAISIRISLSAFRYIATSATPNVTQRPWLTTSAPILIGFLRKLVWKHGSASAGRPRPTL